MKKILIVAVMLCAAMCAVAQSTEVSLQGDFVHNGSFPTSFKGALGTLESGVNLYGVTGELAVNPNKWFGLVGDLSFNRAIKGNENLFTFMGGPELSIRGKKNRIFAHALVGGAYVTQSLQGFKLTALADSSFAYALGAGFDHSFGKHFALRVIQADYIYTDAFDSSEHNVRVSAGIVLK